MLGVIIALIVSFIPCTILFFYLRGLRKEENYQKNCGKMLLKGVLCSLGVALLDLVVNILWALTGLDKVSPLLNAAFHDFIIAAAVEEFVKYMTADRMIKKNSADISWLEVIAFAGITAIGFELIESVVYFFNTNIMQILVRGFTMMHASYGMLMGYFIGKAKKTGNKINLFWAFFLPFLLHGCYDFSLADEFQALNDNLVFVPFIMVAITLVVFFRMLKVIKNGKNDAEYTGRLEG